MRVVVEREGEWLETALLPSRMEVNVSEYSVSSWLLEREAGVLLVSLESGRRFSACSSSCLLAVNRGARDKGLIQASQRVPRSALSPPSLPPSSQTFHQTSTDPDSKH